VFCVTRISRQSRSKRVWNSDVCSSDLIENNPMEIISLPMKTQHLPAVLTLDEVDRILATPDITKPLGLRDRTLLETLYSTGMRRSEERRVGTAREASTTNEEKR